MQLGKEGRLILSTHHQSEIITDPASTLIREITMITSIKNLMTESFSRETSRTLIATLYRKDVLG